MQWWVAAGPGVCVFVFCAPCGVGAQAEEVLASEFLPRSAVLGLAEDMSADVVRLHALSPGMRARVCPTSCSFNLLAPPASFAHTCAFLLRAFALHSSTGWLVCPPLCSTWQSLLVTASSLGFSPLYFGTAGSASQR